MPGLKYTMAEIPGGSTRRVYGTAHWDGTEWRANIGGNLINCRWLDFVAVQGGPIAVDIITDERGQSSALVLGNYSDQPRYPVTLPDPATPPVPPVTIGDGTATLLATASDTWGVGGWGRWATSQRGGEDVYTGTWSGVTVTGAWFYGAPRPELAGKKFRRVQFYLPKRIAAAGSAGAVTVHFHAHANQTKPATDVNRTTSPFDFTVPAGWAGGYIDLPASFGPVLAAGGGISIAGEPYAGFISRLTNPEAGKTLIDWQAA